MTHPAFETAARMLAINMLAAGERDRAVDSIFKDAGRYVAALIAMRLQFSGGITLPRLKQLCTESGFASPARARTLLVHLRHLGFVEPSPERRKGEPQAYAATAKFIEAWRGQALAGLEAVVILEPEVGLLCYDLGRPEVFATFARIQAENLMAGASNFDLQAPLTRALLHRNAGSQISWALLSANDDGFPPRTTLKVSIAALARRFDVSRVHVRRLLAECERERLLARESEGVARFADVGRESIRYFYAQQLVSLLVSAAQTRKTMASPSFEEAN